MHARPINATAARLGLPGRRAAGPAAAIAPDCRHYRGDRPCIHNRLCAGCEHYEPFAERLCIIKLGALGDVIRTLCILPELRRQHPGAHVTWVSLPAGCRMIGGHPLIDRVLPFDAARAMTLAQERFDTVICLDKEPEPCALAMSLFAKRKLGVGLSDWGTPIPLNPEAEHYFHLGLSDELKFRQNAHGYPRLVHEALGLPYRGQRYELPLSDAARAAARAALASRGWREAAPTLAINVGAGKVFANKMWPAEKTAALIQAVRRDGPAPQVVLLGGAEERPIIERVLALLGDAGEAASVIDGGTDHSEREFVAVVDACDVLFSGDTMAMHVAIALGKHVVAVFGPTCAQEIDLFGRGEKLVARVDCGPCYKRTCDRDDACIDAVSVEDAAAAIARGFASDRTYTLHVLPLRKAG